MYGDENGHEIYKDRDGYAGVGDNKVVHREVGLPKGKSTTGDVVVPGRKISEASLLGKLSKLKLWK